MSSLQQRNRFLPFTNNNLQRKQLSMQGEAIHEIDHLSDIPDRRADSAR